MSGDVYRSRKHDPGAAVPEHHPGHQLLGVTAEEKLAERESSLHQEHHGTGSENLLIASKWTLVGSKENKG